MTGASARKGQHSGSHHLDASTGAASVIRGTRVSWAGPGDESNAAGRVRYEP